jgi:hypothetical protein
VEARRAPEEAGDSADKEVETKSTTLRGDIYTREEK